MTEVPDCSGNSKSYFQRLQSEENTCLHLQPQQEDEHFNSSSDRIKMEPSHRDKGRQHACSPVTELDYRHEHEILKKTEDNELFDAKIPSLKKETDVQEKSMETILEQVNSLAAAQIASVRGQSKENAHDGSLEQSTPGLQLSPEDFVNEVYKDAVEVTQEQEVHQTHTYSIHKRNRRKLGSNRRNKERFHVRDSISNLKMEPIGNSCGDEALDTTKVLFSISNNNEQNDKQIMKTGTTVTQNIAVNSAIVNTEGTLSTNKDDKKIHDEEKNSNKDPANLSGGDDGVKMDFMQSPEDGVNAKAYTLDQETLSHEKVQAGQDIILQQKEDTLTAVKDVSDCNAEVCRSSEDFGQNVKIFDESTDRNHEFQEKTSQEITHAQSFSVMHMKRPSDPVEEESPVSLTAEMSKNGNFMPSPNPACDGRQETNETCVIHNKGQRSTSVLQRPTAVHPGQSTSFNEEVGNPDILVQAGQIMVSDRNVDIDIKPAQLTDFTETELLAERTFDLIDSVQNSNTENIINNAFTGQSLVALCETTQTTQNDDKGLEITNLPQEKALKSAQPLVIVTPLEIEKAEVRGAEQEHNNDQEYTQELNNGNEGVLNKHVEMKNTNTNLNLGNSRRKMGSLRRNLESQSKGEPSNQQKNGDNDTKEIQTNFGHVGSDSGSEQSNKTVLEIVQRNYAEKISSGRRRKLGSHRRLHGQRTKVKSHFVESSMKSTDEQSLDKNTMSEVNDSDRILSWNISSSNTGERSEPVSENTVVREIPIHHPSAEISHVQEGAAQTSKTYNVMMIGDGSVGKTSFIKRAESGTFVFDVPATVGLDICMWTVAIDGKPVTLRLWDTTGQEKYHSITRQFIHRAQAFLLMYDITSRKSFSAVNYWADCIQDGAMENVTVLLLGNKCDCAERQVETQEGKIIAKEYNLVFMECSAATGKNVIESLETVARALSQKVDTREETMALHKEPKQKNTMRCC
ncbi:uncharacterized protein rab44 isoform X2 [Antennarius striatus]|uniref:uncharacterized protein rab44 isoform X2 n=1 Tax=Antennarius striatus TaxID=241820 RepID=UPI0035B05511